MTAYYNTFVKQAKLWEIGSAIPQPDPEAELAARHDADSAIVTFESPDDSPSEDGEYRRAA